MTEFGGLLKSMREARPIYLSQSKLAERARVNHSYVSRLESGARMPTRDAVDRLAEALGVTPVERDHLLDAAGFASTQSVSPAMLSEARNHLVSALALIGGTA